MDKILSGVIHFHEQMASGLRPSFYRLATEGQHPRALFITCADSRVNPNLITSTEPGDLFIIRNIGNLVPPYEDVKNGGDTSVAAAIRYTLDVLGVKNVILCGHSQCGAMKSVVEQQQLPEDDPLHRWLKYADKTLEWGAGEGPLEENEVSRYDSVARRNVLQQLNNLRGYPGVQERIAEGELHLHGWYHVIETAEVQVFHPGRNRFVTIDTETANEIMYLRQLFTDSPNIGMGLTAAQGARHNP